MAQRNSQPTPGAADQAKSARAVKATLASVTRPVPKRCISRLLTRLERMVPACTTMLM